MSLVLYFTISGAKALEQAALAVSPTAIESVGAV
jgi:hypothetical protein